MTATPDMLQAGDSYLAEVQRGAAEQSEQFLANAAATEEAKAAADWSLAAKNAIQVALTCEQINRTRRGAQR